MSLIEFKDVVKVYGNEENRQVAVDHVNFTIDAGEFVVVLGQSGAGKSTILNMLGGMDRPTEGSIEINGQKIETLNDNEMSDFRADHIGFIFQFYNLLPSLTAYENVALTKDIVKNAYPAEEMLEAVGLKEHMNKFPSQLSGGEQQRVSIARAISKNPDIILGDEPTGALDSETGISVLELLHKMSRERNKTVIMVTHNAAFGDCADKVIRLKNGKIREIMVNENPLPISEVTW